MPLYHLPCLNCGAEIRSDNPRSPYCSYRCHSAARRVQLAYHATRGYRISRARLARVGMPKGAPPGSAAEQKKWRDLYTCLYLSPDGHSLLYLSVHDYDPPIPLHVILRQPRGCGAYREIAPVLTSRRVEGSRGDYHLVGTAQLPDERTASWLGPGRGMAVTLWDKQMHRISVIKLLQSDVSG